LGGGRGDTARIDWEKTPKIGENKPKKNSPLPSPPPPPPSAIEVSHWLAA